MDKTVVVADRARRAFIAGMGSGSGTILPGASGGWRSPRNSRSGTSAAAGTALALLIWVRGSFGTFFAGALAAICIATALYAKPEIAQIAPLFLAPQLALSMASRGDYPFVQHAETGAGKMPADSQQMAQWRGRRS